MGNTVSRRAWLTGSLLCTILSLGAQDFGWWNAVHDWDGTTPWPNYITLTPAFLGPNALPVPEVRNGRLRTTPTLRLAGEAHFSRGDDTQNAWLDLNLPLFSDRASVSLQYVPLEYYRMDVATRDLRAARDFDGKGTASGDVYLGTHIQLLRDHARWPDVLLTFTLRTASGNRLSAARFTDTPGYYFDLSVGKSYAVTEWVSLRPHLMLGFYAWQTYRNDYFQNDALLYGVGVDLELSKLTVTTALGGYSGYIGQGDRPVVYRLGVETRRGARVEYLGRVEWGLRDFPYRSLRLGVGLRLWNEKP